MRRKNDLVIGTHGRAIYILDDIAPLRKLNSEILKKEIHIFKTPDAYQYQNSWMPLAYVSPGSDVFFGKNKKNIIIIQIRAEFLSIMKLLGDLAYFFSCFGVIIGVGFKVILHGLVGVSGV